VKSPKMRYLTQFCILAWAARRLRANRALAYSRKHPNPHHADWRRHPDRREGCLRVWDASYWPWRFRNFRAILAPFATRSRPVRDPFGAPTIRIEIFGGMPDFGMHAGRSRHKRANRLAGRSDAQREAGSLRSVWRARLGGFVSRVASRRLGMYSCPTWADAKPSRRLGMYSCPTWARARM